MCGHLGGWRLWWYVYVQLDTWIHGTAQVEYCAILSVPNFSSCPVRVDFTVLFLLLGSFPTTLFQNVRCPYPQNQSSTSVIIIAAWISYQIHPKILSQVIYTFQFLSFGCRRITTNTLVCHQPKSFSTHTFPSRLKLCGLIYSVLHFLCVDVDFTHNQETPHACLRSYTKTSCWLIG